MNECEKLHNDLKAFLDGQLSPASRIALRLHLNRCESCRKELEEMRQLGTRLRADDSLEMSDALRARILASVPTAAPEAKVKMLPRWREKPVLLWGASASAALAWFMLYPALNNYQTSSHANSRKTSAMSAMYVQDHDDVTRSYEARYEGVAPAPSRHYFANDKNDATHLNLNIRAGNGRASGDTGVSRQDPRLATMLGQDHSHTDKDADEKNLYFDSNRATDVAGTKSDKGSPYFPHANGLTPLIGNGNGNPVGSTERYQVTHGRMAVGKEAQAAGESADHPYTDPSQNLLQEGVASGTNPGHGVRRWTFPKTYDLKSGYEKVETDPAISGAAPPLHTRRGTLPPVASENQKGYSPNNVNYGVHSFSGQTFGAQGEVLDAPHEADAQAVKPSNPTPTGHFRSATNQASNASEIRNGEPRAYIDFADDLPTERQVHREASLTVEVANAEQQTEAVERLVKESKGYVAQNQLSTQEDNTRQASLTCKVPVDQFDTVMGQIARLGLLKGKTLSGEDITEKVSDEQETSHVLRADIATTQEKLKTRRKHSETVRDEETLRQLRIRVAQSQARLKMLTRLGALSEITVELDEKPKNPAPEVKPASPFMEEVSGTGAAAAHSFLMALRLPVQLLVWIVVYSPLWALLIYGYRRMTR